MVKREELPIDDVVFNKQYVNDEVLISPTYKQAIVVNLGNHKHFVKHRDGRKFLLLPHSFSAAPTSVARDLVDDDRYIVLSMKEAEKYIEKSRNGSAEANKDIIEFNKKVKDHNDKVRKGELEDQLWLKKKPLLIKDNSPYHHLMRSREEKPKKVKKIKRGE